ncbi:MAG: hypothetical protein M1814_006338 [Vezdaea aestivalis]|nr:MAG: hypothetical protein M1814_006338 [Vezdaea aestivalis]
MGRSLESSRPILASSPTPQTRRKGTSRPLSTYSTTPSVACSDNTTTSSNDPRLSEIKEFSEGLDRLEVKRLQQQRFEPSLEKTENLSKLALGAKLERALGRRMTGQDAVLRPKGRGEKVKVLSEKVEVK